MESPRNADQVFTSAASLYREMRRRGLELRKGNGRDDALQSRLCEKLGCPTTALQKFLDSHEISAESFICRFMELSEPFARMYREVWEYVASKNSTAVESISIRFGLDATTDVDLSSFRRQIETIESVTVPYSWGRVPARGINGLYAVRDAVVDRETLNAWQPTSAEGNGRAHYGPGIPNLIPVQGSSPPFVFAVHDLLDQLWWEALRIESTDGSVWSGKGDRSDERTRLVQAITDMTDLLPGWSYIFLHGSSIEKDRLEAGSELFDSLFPGVISPESQSQVRTTKYLDVLDLPFWKFRWHLYEIWTTVLTLKCLAEYKPLLSSEDSLLNIGRHNPVEVASLTALNGTTVKMESQVPTPYRHTSVVPDLRARNQRNNEVFAIVEAKQRKALTSQHAADVFDRYMGAHSKCTASVIVNYDVADIELDIPTGCYLFQGVVPGAYEAQAKFGDTLREAFRHQGLTSQFGRICVLLDTSSSMADYYSKQDVRSDLTNLMSFPELEMFRFSDTLIDSQPMMPNNLLSIMTSGGTNLSGTLDTVLALRPAFRLVVALTDGDYSPSLRSEQRSLVQEVRPDSAGVRRIKSMIETADIFDDERGLLALAPQRLILTP